MLPVSPVFIILALASCVLFYVGFADLQNYKIKNEMVLILAMLYFAYVFAAGTWHDALWHVAVALVVFMLLLSCYAYAMLGGGDVKLLTVAFLWVGMECASLFSIVLLLIAGAHATLVYIGLVGAQTINGRKRIAYAPAIAGALIVVFGSGCLQHPGAM
jgi:prepilin peptidase CpaA